MLSATLLELLAAPLDDDGARRLSRDWLCAAIVFSDEEPEDDFSEICSAEVIELFFDNEANFESASDHLLSWIVSKSVDPFPFWDVFLAIKYRLSGDLEFTPTRIRRLIDRCPVMFRQLGLTVESAVKRTLDPDSIRTENGLPFSDLKKLLGAPTPSEHDVIEVVRENGDVHSQKQILDLLSAKGKIPSEGTVKKACAVLMQRRLLARHPSGKGYVLGPLA
jgi:hypothetical protein